MKTLFPPDELQHSKPLGKHVLILGLLAVLLATLAAVSLGIGSKTLTLEQLHAALADSTQSVDRSLILSSRLPRALLAILAGAGLGAAGLLAQSLTRNPLAEPGILGVNAGASLAIVTAVGFFGVSGFSGYAAFAFLGALFTAGLVYLIGRPGAGASDPVRLVLSGVAIGAIFTGLGTALSLVRPQAFDQLRAWTIGSLQGRDASILVPLALLTGAGILLAALCARSLDGLALGDDAATALGINVRATRILGLIALTLLAASATAAVGAIGFIGLMAPHAARRLAGSSTPWVLAYTCLLAPMLLLVADVLGRVMLPGELQAGVVCAFIGAPLLIALARSPKAASL
ncbi:iron chelate uptake ABC transporter family permease subunit [Glutamicibacter sp. JL.03c]|uniref:iron chelate uptake ABC transporter family permease subunit n=1 Tax=Glutamicibacter sp. JL.03c TaxID=2984842 RepID=UPI0021F76928|nr:iron chelate uptake ABC transporter family permease subunit [Glutamicibacter sp. JL.03c]UYQ77877.1 iron chelate uptake ABC transporter family permease subunit [Glutamicibacter sp. JL.03c]